MKLGPINSLLYTFSDLRIDTVPGNVAKLTFGPTPTNSSIVPSITHVTLGDPPDATYTVVTLDLPVLADRVTVEDVFTVAVGTSKGVVTSSSSSSVTGTVSKVEAADMTGASTVSSVGSTGSGTTASPSSNVDTGTTTSSTSIIGTDTYDLITSAADTGTNNVTNLTYGRQEPFRVVREGYQLNLYLLGTVVALGTISYVTPSIAERVTPGTLRVTSATGGSSTDVLQELFRNVGNPTIAELTFSILTNGGSGSLLLEAFITPRGTSPTSVHRAYVTEIQLPFTGVSINDDVQVRHLHLADNSLWVKVSQRSGWFNGEVTVLANGISIKQS